MSDTPTQRLPEQPESPQGELADERKKSRTLMGILIGVGAALLIALIVLLILLLTNNGAATPATTPTATPTSSASSSTTPSASPTPSETPSPTPTPTTAPPQPQPTAAPPADDGNVHVTSFAISPTTCSANQETTLHVTWQSTNGLVAYFGVNTTDAQGGGMGWDLPGSGSSDQDFPDGYRPYQVTCPAAGDTVSYTITIVGNGSKASKTVTLKGS